ncbi:four helix bundle protein [Patescibacteria group bacterium]|nr:four helix bundle protein [Patescibacteria group bacterium]MBU1922474.1 four helix bundle protein [Patescibacteria group bacterium]
MPVLQKAKEAYLYWYRCHQTLPKIHRHTLGQKIDILFVETIQEITTASFLGPKEKITHIRWAIQKIDTLKIFLMMLWEVKSLDNKKYTDLSLKIDEIGRMLGGWHGQLLKQNSPDARSGEK